MKRIALIVVLMLVASAIATTQENKAEVFGGWQFTSLDLKKDQSGIDRQSAPKGWDIDFAFKATRNMSIVADLSGASKNLDTVDLGGIGVTPNVHVQNYLFGPRFSVKSGKVTPFAEVLVGFAHTSFGVKASGMNASVGSNGLGFAFGGGLDVNASKHLSVRLAKFDYLLNRVNFDSATLDMSTGTMSMNHFRYSTGIVFKF